MKSCHHIYITYMKSKSKHFKHHLPRAWASTCEHSLSNSCEARSRAVNKPIVSLQLVPVLQLPSSDLSERDTVTVSRMSASAVSGAPVSLLFELAARRDCHVKLRGCWQFVCLCVCVCVCICVWIECVDVERGLQESYWGRSIRARTCF